MVRVWYKDRKKKPAVACQVNNRYSHHHHHHHQLHSQRIEKEYIRKKNAREPTRKRHDGIDLFEKLNIVLLEAMIPIDLLH